MSLDTSAFSDEYEILDSLGAGELGEVFHARHRASGAETALRVFRPEVIAVPGAAEALRDLIDLSRTTQHPHLGQQLGLDEAGTAALATEYVAGKPLLEIMRERGVAPPAAVIDLGTRLLGALGAVHAAGLAHGRVHAGNVLLEREKHRWVLLDLGHRYAVEGLEPPYDLYCVGALLYELATGHSAFEAPGTPPSPREYVPSLPEGLSQVLLRGVDPDPERWFESAEEFSAALADAALLV